MILFCVPPKAKPLLLTGMLSERPRCNASVAGLTIGGALLAAGYDFQFVDCAADAVAPGPHIESMTLARYGMSDDEWASTILELRPHALLISSLFTTDQAMFERVASVARRVMPTLPIVVGGLHATAMPEWHLGDDLADYVVLGEGEDIIVELLREILRPHGAPDSVRGVAFRGRGGDVVTTGPPGRIADVRRPWATNEVAITPQGHFRYKNRLCTRGAAYGPEGGARSFVLYGSRGCPMACPYCSSTGAFGSKLRHFGAERMFADFLYCRQHLGVEVFYNQSDTLLVSDEDIRFLKLVAGYRSRSADHGFVLNNPNAFFARLFFQRTGSQIHINESILDVVAASGFGVLTVAVETFSPRLNRKYDVSKIGPPQIAELATAAGQRGMAFDAYMMYAFPGQTEDELLTDIAAAQVIKSTGGAVSWSGVLLLPGTQYFADALREQRLSLSEYRDAVNRGYGFGHPHFDFNCVAIPTDRLARIVEDHHLVEGWSYDSRSLLSDHPTLGRAAIA